ncbi:MAG: ComEA family DNA-binding protein [Candidatus Omnitrophica bacterium]|nr:ComEA family DNA-binding protein [Candidatus Omnitrophota bacterium]MDD5671571.1 ComEA family DNA-binding protein [Candidatus Omnitrophota bacterium]
MMILLRHRLWGIVLAVSFLMTGMSLAFVERLDAAPNVSAEVQSTALSVVNINKAGSEELQTIRGVGPRIAERIIQYRDQNGPFKNPEDLAKVRGVGSAKLQKIKDQIKV